MNRLSVTVIDVLGLLVPGFVFVIGIALTPIPSAWLEPLSKALHDRLPLLTNPWVAGGSWLAIAYVLGFLMRLTSITIMNRLTVHRWKPRLEREAAAVDELFAELIANSRLTESLKRLASLCSERDPARYAPYFHFAKRLIRTNNDLWAEAERLEAEVRFSAGLFFPFVVLALDGVLGFFLGFSRPAASILILVGVAGVVIIIQSFPSRRAKEFLYDQFLALVMLRQGMPSSLESPKDVTPEAAPVPRSA
jgi:hypothetical protein